MRRILLFILMFFLIYLDVLAQDEKTIKGKIIADSLISRINNPETSDTARAWAAVQLTESPARAVLDEKEHALYCDLAIDIADSLLPQINDADIRISLLRSKALALNNKQIVVRDSYRDFDKAYELIESSIEINEELKNEYRMAENYWHLSFLSSILGKYEDANQYAKDLEYHYERYLVKKPDISAIELNNKYRTIGFRFYRAKNRSEAARLYKKAEKILLLEVEKLKIQKMSLQGADLEPGKAEKLDLQYEKNMSALGHTYEQLNDVYEDDIPDSAVFYGKKIISTFREIGDSMNMASGYWHTGSSFEGLLEDSIAAYMNVAEEIFIAIKDTIFQIRIYLEWSERYNEIGEFYRALNYSYKALDLSKEIDNDPFVKRSHGYLGYSFLKQEDYKKALHHYKLASENATTDIGDMANINIKQARCYYGMNEIDLAFEKAIKADSLYKAMGTFYDASKTNMVLANCYWKKGLFDEARIAYRKSIDERKRNFYNGLSLAEIYISYAEFLEEQNEIDSAIFYAKSGYKYTKDLDELQIHERALNVLYKMYDRKGNKDKTNDYLKELIEVKELRTEKARIYETRNLAYRVEHVEDSLKLVDLANQAELEYQLEIGKKDQTRNVLIGLAVLILLLAAGLYSRMLFIRRTNRQLEKAKWRAERSESFKQQFLANMSHEIRTPMNAILGMTNLTLDTDLKPKQKQYLQAVKKSTENLLVIINDILDLSKLEAGKMDLELIPFALEDQLNIVKDTMRFKAEEKGLDVSIEIDKDLPEFIKGDPYRLNQILINLSGNAVKFTEKGSVKIKAKKEGDMIRFSVTDTGIGLSTEKTDKLFTAFQQADESTTRKYGGTGLGLSISKSLVELQNGKIGVNSEEGKGSEFYFTLPFEPASEHDILDLIKEKKFDVSKLKGIKILLAEDNKFNQIVLHDTIKHLIDSATVDIAENGRVAVDMLSQNDYHLVLMDINMPEMDGHEATQFIRTQMNGIKKDTKILALTASILSEDIKSFEKSGMNDYIPKPFTREELLGTLIKHYEISD